MAESTMAEITVSTTKTVQDVSYEPYVVHSKMTDTVGENETRAEKAKEMMKETDQTTIAQIVEHIKQMEDS